MHIELKKILSLLVLPAAMLGLIAGAVGVFADGPTGTTKYPLYLDMDVKEYADSGHVWYGGNNQIEQKFRDMWANLKITIEDKNGKRALASGMDDFARKKVGDYAEGDKITITVDPSSIVEGYHMSYQHEYKYPQAGSPQKGHFNKFEITYKPTVSNFNGIESRFMLVRMPFAFMDVQFDLQGGNVDGQVTPIRKTVKKDNSVDFPANPTKANLSFGGWYTRTAKPNVRTFYWNQENAFSDYNCDLQRWNDESVDKYGDNVFLLRASWIAKVTFDTDGGGAIDPVKLKEGEKVAAPATAPKKKFAEFKGWQKDGSDYDFESLVMGDMTLKAKWDEYTLAKTQDQSITVGDSFDAEDGIINKDKLPQGTTLSPVGELDTTTVGTKNVKLLVKYPNGDEQEVEYKLTVKAKEEAKPEPKPEDGTLGNSGIIKAENNVAKPLQTGTAPNTGDSIDLRLYASLMAMSGAIMIAATAAFARAKNEK